MLLPAWDAPNLGVDFLRGWGRFEQRRLGGDPTLASEGHYCDAARALRFRTVLSQHPIGPTGNRCHLACAFRRLYGSQAGFMRVEAGFARRRRELPRRPLQGAELLRLLEDIRRVPLAIGQTATTLPLTQVGPLLASHYLQSTTDRQLASAVTIEDWLVTAARPMVYVQYHPSEVDQLPPFAVPAEVPGLALAVHLNREIPLKGGSPLPAWYVAVDGGSESRDRARRLRIHLLRRHSERECLRIVLQHLAKGRISAQGDAPEAKALRQVLERASQVFALVNGAPDAGPGPQADPAFRLDELLGAADRQALAEGLGGVLPASLRTQLDLDGTHITIRGATTINDNRITTGTVIGEHIAIGHGAAA